MNNNLLAVGVVIIGVTAVIVAGMVKEATLATALIVIASNAVGVLGGAINSMFSNKQNQQQQNP